MKRLCACLCCVLLLLTACGRPAAVLPTEAVTAATQSGTESVTQPAETGESQTQTTAPLTQASTTESQTQPSSEPATTQAATSVPATATTATTAPRETHTLFAIPDRTTGVRTTRAAANTTKRTTTTTTTTTTTAASGYIPQVQPVRKTCTVTIDCRELREHPEELKQPEKAAFVPKNGYIVQNVTVEFKDGESVYDVLRRVCATHTCTDNCRFCQAEGIQMESSYSPQFDSYYVEGIHQLYEKDCGGTSGWTYWVNGVFPNYGCSDYTVRSGDRIEWIYSVTLDENESF